jgi:hypothetical protein
LRYRFPYRIEGSAKNADGACNSAASPIVFFRISDQQIETDHGRFMDG